MRHAGSGQLDARDFPVSRATLDVSGSGLLRATAAETISIEIAGSGDVDWWGTATVARADVGGSGHITHR